MKAKEILKLVKKDVTEMLTEEKERTFNYNSQEGKTLSALCDGMQVAYKNVLDIIAAYEKED